MSSLVTVAALYGLEQNVGYPGNRNRSNRGACRDILKSPRVTAVTRVLCYESNLLP